MKFGALVVAIAIAGCADTGGPLDASVPDGRARDDAAGATGCAACSVACTVFAEGLEAPGTFLFAAGANGVTWSNGLGPILIETAPAPFGTPVRVLASEPTIDAATADDVSAYWLRGNASGGDDVMQVPLAGGAAPRRLASTSFRDFPGVLIFDANALYFLDGRTPRTLVAMDKGGGVLRPVATGFGILAALSDGANVFYVDFSNGATRLMQTRATGGVPAVIATVGYTRVLRADVSRLYVSDGALRAVPMTPGAMPIAITEGVCGQFVIGDGRAYFLDTGCPPFDGGMGGSGAVRWVATGGPPVHTICDRDIAPLALAWSMGVLYVADGVSGSILRLVP